MNLVIDTTAADKTNSAVTSITNDTPVTQLEQLMLGDSVPLTITFTDGSAAPAWAGLPGYTLTVGLGDLDVNGLLNRTSTSNFTPITAGWSGRLSLATQSMIDGMAFQVGFSVDRSRYPQGLPGGGRALPLPRFGWFQLQIEVTDPDGFTTSYANLRVAVLNRVLPSSLVVTPAPSDAIYAFLRSAYVQNRTLTGIASNVASDSLLCGLATAIGAQPVGAKLLVAFPNNIEAIFELVASTSTSVGWLFRPFDYNASTNPYQWRLRQVFYLGAPCFPNVGTGLWHENSAIGADGSAIPAMNPTGFALPS